MGLLNSIGIGIGAAANAAQPFILNMQQEEIQKLRDDRMAEIAKGTAKYAADLAESKDIAKEGRARERTIADVKSINDIADTRLASEAMQGLAGGAGIGSSVSAENLANLHASPDAVKIYQQAGAKGLFNAPRAEELKARADAALGIGNLDLAKEFESQSKGQRDERRLDQAAIKEDHNFKKIMAAADRAADAAERANEKTEVTIQIKSLDAQRDSIKMQYDQKASQVKILQHDDSHADTSILDNEMTKLAADYTAIATQMASLGDNVKKGGADDSNSGTGKYAHLYGGDKSGSKVGAAPTAPPPAAAAPPPPAAAAPPPAPVKTEKEIANEQYQKTGVVAEHYKKVPYGRGGFRLEKMVNTRAGWR